ncbi:MAG: B12-binding domain-containing radical SAM protein [Cyanobacteriota bacterium]|nr:B12-binding domain-containing radical SAM protein [Cyanobacteriota bacterium]
MRAMRVLLLHPKPPSTFWSFEGALQLVGQRALLPPLGLITVAALLPAHWELRLVDEQVRAATAADWNWANLVILSAMLVQRQSLAGLISLAKAHGLPVAVGGPFATSTPQAPELRQADFLLLDEGELSVPPFVAAVEGGAVRGRFDAGGERADVSLSPVPRFDLLERDAYHVMAVQFSRGCPFQCEFCDIIVLYGRRPRTKEPGQLLRELEELHRLGWRGEIFLVDDNFIGNRRNVRRLLAELEPWQQRRGQPFRFTTEASLDLASDPNLIEAMVSCGFHRVFLGIETPDAGSLQQAGKHQNLRHPLLDAVATIRGLGLQVMAGFILGFDGESAGAGQRITAFVEETAIPLAMVGVLQALPNTALWQRLAAEGRLLDAEGVEAEGAEAVDQGVQTHLLNFRPDRPMAEIAGEFLSCFDALYQPQAFLERAYRSCLQQGMALPADAGAATGMRRPPAGMMRALGTLSWRLGIRRSGRWAFWRRLIDLVCRRPGTLPDFLWLLLAEEHMVQYGREVHRQVEAQLASPWLR